MKNKFSERQIEKLRLNPYVFNCTVSSVGYTFKFKKRALAKFLRIIGDNNRLKILCLLKTGEKCVCEIYPQLDLSQNLVSSHLKIMLAAQLLNCRRDWKKSTIQ